MYIPPFWCGVAATLLIELVATIIYATVSLKNDVTNDSSDSSEG